MLAIDNRALRICWTVFLFGLSIFLIFKIRETLLVFAGAIFFAYMLSPIVGLIERFLPKRRTLALALVYILLVGALVGIGFALLPTLASEATSLATRLPSLITSGKVATLPLPAFLEPMRDQLMGALRKEASNLQTSVVPFIQEASTQILSGVGALVPIILVPILAFFFLKDARSMRAALVESLQSDSQRRTFDQILSEMHLMLQSYIRALVILAVASFAAWAVFLSIMQEPYELLLAGLAGILEFIPVVGPAAALAIMLIVCGVAGSGGLLWIIVFWALYRVFQDYVLNPYLMSSGVELHPLLVLFGVLAGEKIGGIPGMFFSVPALAMLKVTYVHLRRSARSERVASLVS
jgi:predicted PurR-regulated permease PerM